MLCGAALALGAGLLAYGVHALRPLESASLDARFAIRGGERAPEVAVVNVDEKTFSELKLQWPFPRGLHADVIRRLHALGARAIAYDVQFTEPSDRRDDLALFRAAGEAGHVIFATTEVNAQGESDILGGEANLREIGAVAAASNLPADPGGVIRRYPYRLIGLPSLATAAARMAGAPVSSSRFDGHSALIDFRGPPGTIAPHSFVDVLRGRVSRSAIAGKIVVVGASTPTLQDLHQTSTTSSAPMAGPEIQANAIWTALHANPLQPAPGWLAWLTIVVAAVLAPLFSLRLRVLASVLLALAAAAAYAALAQVAFDSGSVMLVAYPLAALAIGSVAMLAAHYVGAFVERNSFLRQLRESQIELISRLVAAVESRDAETGGHVRRIGILCERVALELGWSREDAEMLRHASAMHDIGKIGIPDRVLLKAGKLDEEEWAIVKAHTTAGGEILADSANPHVRTAEQIARSHHERWDGGGYPDGLKGEEIPIAARICAVCDVYDALLSKRSYKDAWELSATLEQIRVGSGTHFDPTVVDAFLRIADSLDEELRLADAPVRSHSAVAPAAG